MLFEKHGLLVRILDSDDNKIREYQVGETDGDTIQCWIPSVEGRNFKIEWEIVENLHKKYDMHSMPHLDGIPMTGFAISKKYMTKGRTAQHYRQTTGNSTARLYEFGRRVLTDDDNYVQPDKLQLDSLNTIKLVFEWGHKGVPKPRDTYYVPPEIGPVHEKAVKKGHSGAAKLGKNISVSNVSNGVRFQPSEDINPVTFVFCYAPENWLRARDIIPSAKPEPEDVKPTLKRERVDSPDIIDIDDLESDDDEVQIVKHLIPAPTAQNKRRRMLEQGYFKVPKKEEDW